MAACYGFKDESNLTKAGFFLVGQKNKQTKKKKTKKKNIQTKKTKKKLTATQRPPKLEFLPPTTAVFQLNVLRAHFQACIWMNWLEENPTKIDPVKASKTKNAIFLI